MFKKCFLLPLGLLIASSLAAQSTTLLNDVFNSATGSPVTFTSTTTVGTGAQALPASAAWFMSAAATGTATYTNGSPAGTMVVSMATSSSVLAYFTASGTPQTLNVGDTLTATFSFTTSIPGTTPTNGFRVALLNSTGGTRDTKGTGNSSANYAAGYAGFDALFNPNAGQGTDTLAQRTAGAGSTLLLTTAPSWTTIATAGATAPGLTSGHLYQGVLSLNISPAGTMNVSFQINDSGNPVAGYTLTGSSSSSIPTAFDTFAIGGNGGVANSITLSNLQVVYNPSPAAAPAFSPIAGTYTAAQSVTLTSSTSASAKFVYTTDGTTPTESGGTPTNGTLNTGSAISISSTTTLNAIAFVTGSNGDSPVSSALYTINYPQAFAPTFAPVAGTYASAQSITLSSTTAGASFAYTLDGTTPTESGGTVTNGTLYAGPVSLNYTAVTNLQAIAFKTGLLDSTVTSGTYTINIAGQVAAPTFSLLPGTYTGTQSVTLSSTTAGASFAYTTDGTTPTESGGTVTHGTLNTGTAISVASPTTINAIAFKTGLTDSAVIGRTYTVLQPAAAPVFSPAAGSYVGAQAITLSSTTAGASFAYTTDGSTPTESGGTVTHGTLYSGAVSVNSSATLNAIAFESGFADSTVSTAAYTIIGTVAAPAFSPVAGTYTVGQLVTLGTNTAGASIAYTTDGTTPTESGGTVTHGTLYSGTALMIGTTTTLKAIGFKTGMADSAVSTGVYTINIIVLPNSNSGSGGALDTWFLGALAALGVLRWRRKRR